jgi:Ni/Fe-hydrogenase b-type cytochrome subunit
MKVIGVVLAAVTVLATGLALGQTSLMHPHFRLLDAEGKHVLESGEPVSTMETCGNCHDTGFIATHSFHADVGLQNLRAPGRTASGRPWDTSPGLFGRWNPLIYRYLSPEGDERIDLGTAAWIQLMGARHIGGGPAFTSRDGGGLSTLVTGDAVHPDTHVADPETGAVTPWDWSQSGGVEMNCFLCHIPRPNNETRLDALANGEFRWAATATLEGTGIVERADGEWRWNSAAFDTAGLLEKDFVKIQDPDNDNCGLCHGLVQVDPSKPLITTGCLPGHWSTETTGQILSPQRIRDSGMNLAAKGELSRAWDIHSERLVQCVDCHYSLNNPIYRQEDATTRPVHLRFDARRMDISEYLYRPSHQFAKGQATQGALAPELSASMRRCESCHEAEATHNWLPYKDRHFSVMSCESCHIPYIYAPARRRFDWTVITRQAEPAIECRGGEGDKITVDTLIEGFQPVLLPRHEIDGTTSLVPHNLVSAWYWVAGDPERPVLMRDLKAAYLDGTDYARDVVQTLDENGDGALQSNELRLDTEEKVALIRRRLRDLGLENPRIEAEIQPYGIHHDVATGDWATKDCQTCHEKGSRLSKPMLLASYVPGGVEPKFVEDANVSIHGEIARDQSGRLFYQPSTTASGLYVLGHDRVRLANAIGLLAVLGVLLGVAVHGGLRYRASRSESPSSSKKRRIYMYSAYERLWHWLQSLAIMTLLFTGLEIHFPGTVSLFGFSLAVRIHSIVAFIVVANAFLAAFYHLASGQIRQYLPEPKGFFSQAIQQTRFYLRGIFKGEPHPFEKVPEQRLNPLQQVTYLAILNVLLPLQVLTGLAIWGAERWPDFAVAIGGLAYVGPLHALVAWLFAAFLIMHIYLTTTGHTPMTNIKAMVGGWEEVYENEGESHVESRQPSRA